MWLPRARCSRASGLAAAGSSSIGARSCAASSRRPRWSFSSASRAAACDALRRGRAACPVENGRTAASAWGHSPAAHSTPPSATWQCAPSIRGRPPGRRQDGLTERAQPFGRPLDIAGAVARRQERAARRADGPRIVDLSAAQAGEGLFEVGEPGLEPALRDERVTEVGERAGVQAHIVEPGGDCQRPARAVLHLRGVRAIAGQPGQLPITPLDAGTRLLEQPACPLHQPRPMDNYPPPRCNSPSRVPTRAAAAGWQAARSSRNACSRAARLVHPVIDIGQPAGSHRVDRLRRHAGILRVVASPWGMDRGS